ncbi:hypothetical protein MXD62_13420 [Frankia sp. Mgl5]|nr:hypothetical protein [Frankia sp. Mgl5]MCK9928161.1 hypothetical protein [Frankia sp. Mgl5]
MFADQELEALRKFPEIGREELFRFFTHSSPDWPGPAWNCSAACPLVAQG